MILTDEINKPLINKPNSYYIYKVSYSNPNGVFNYFLKIKFL